MTVHPIRWWIIRAFGRTPLGRAADRVEAWAIFMGLLILVAAAYPALAAGHASYAAREHSIATEATRHSVDATATGAGTSDPAMSESTLTTFILPVRWQANNTVHDTTVKVDKPMKTGDHLRIWLNDKGNVTTAPLTDTDARVEAVGTATLLWLVMAAAIGAALAVLRHALDRSRDRGWDRGLLELVDNGGGSTTRKS